MTGRVGILPIAICMVTYSLELDAAQTLTTDTLSFQDMPGVFVVVEPLDTAVERHGLFADSLRELIETKLANVGIRLLTEDEWQTTFGNPMAFLDVNLARVSERMYMYQVQLELRQLVVLVRDSTIPAFTPTWKSGQTLGVMQGAQLRNLREHVSAAVDRFIDAYAAANRRRRRSQRDPSDETAASRPLSASDVRTAVVEPRMNTDWADKT